MEKKRTLCPVGGTATIENSMEVPQKGKNRSKLRVAGVEGGRGVRWVMVVGRWTLGRVCVVMSAVYCVKLMNHRPVSMKQIIDYVLVKEGT